MGKPAHMLDRKLDAWLPKSLLLGCSLSALILALPARAEDYPLQHDNFGGVGMIEMPSAGMAPDGQFAVGASFFQNTQHYDISFQALPWLETSFRYSGLKHFDPNFSMFYDRSFARKPPLSREDDILPAVSVGINDLVGTGVYSGEYLVATKHVGPVEATLGMGWGRLATADAVRNPLGLVFPTFNNRVNDTTGVGQFPLKEYFRGREAGIFGGAIWHTPIPKLSLIAEYSSDAYVSERARGNFTPRSQVNLGLSYAPFEAGQIGLNWMYGRALGFNFSLQTDPTRDSFPQRIEPPMPELHIRTAEEQQLALRQMTDNRIGAAWIAHDGNQGALVDAIWQAVPGAGNVALKGRSLIVTVSASASASLCSTLSRTAAAYGSSIDGIVVLQNGRKAQACTAATPQLEPATLLASVGGQILAAADDPAPRIIDAALSSSSRAATIARIKADFRKQKIAINAISLTTSDAYVYYANTSYFHEREAVERLTRVLTNDAPPSIERFHFISTSTGQAQTEFTILRMPLERAADQGEPFSLLANGNHMAPAPLDVPVLASAERKTFPRLNWSIFPQFRQQLFDPSNPFAVQFLAGAAASVDLTSKLSVQAEVEGNLYDNFNINRAPDSELPHVRTDFLRFFTKGKNGIGELETDYRFRLAPTVYGMLKAGYLESMYAGVGGEMLWRPQGQRWALGVDMYEVQERNFDRLFGLQHYRVATGHVSLYYSSPWYDLNFMVMAGRYLAGDNGMTFQISRRFATGFELGVFATKTNVSAAQFGEGSFDKGFFIRVPMNWALPLHTQNELAMAIRPVQRDGGQRLEADAVLYDLTRRQSEVAIYQDEENGNP